MTLKKNILGQVELVMSFYRVRLKAVLIVPFLFLLLFSLPFYYSPTGSGLFDLSDVKKFPVDPILIFFSTFAIIIFHDACFRKITFGARYESFGLLVFFSLVYFVFILSSLYGFTQQQLNFCIYMLSVYLFFIHVSKDAVLTDYFSSTLILVGVLHGAIGLYMMFAGGVYILFDYAAQYPNYFRLHGLMANPNYAANVLGLAFLFSIYKNGIAEKKIINSFLLLCFVLTFSRGAILALFLSLMFSLLLVGSWRFLFRYLLVVALCVIIVVMVVDYSLLLRLLRADDLENISTLSGRVDIWGSAFERIVSGDPFIFLFGHGYGSFSELIGAGAHSFYIKALFENGFIFVFIFLCFSLFFVFTVKRKVVDLPTKWGGFCCVAIFLFFLIRSLTSPSIFSGGYPGFIFVFYLMTFFRSGLIER